MSRRVVRVTPDFFWAWDAQLPDDRGPNGEPSRAEFAASELLDIIGTFAENVGRVADVHPRSA